MNILCEREAFQVIYIYLYASCCHPTLFSKVLVHFKDHPVKGKKNERYCFLDRTAHTIILWSSFTLVRNHLLTIILPWTSLLPEVSIPVLCVRACLGKWRVPQWLSPQIVKEAHGKFSPWAKPQAFSIISEDFSFLVPFKKVIITDVFFFF